MRPHSDSLAPVFRERYSPRSFTQTAVTDEELQTILSAAATAPSCFNEQPWRFVLGEKEDFHAILAPANLEWCRPLETFVLLCSAPAFARNGKPNRWASFDCGTAWGYMTVQAHALGISAHAMAGFDPEKARQRFPVEGLHPEAVIVFGRAKPAEEFTPRRPLDDLILRK